MRLSKALWDHSHLLSKEAVAALFAVHVRKDLDSGLFVAQLVNTASGRVWAWTGGGTCVVEAPASQLNTVPGWLYARAAMYQALSTFQRALRLVDASEEPPAYEAPIGVAGWAPVVVGSASA